MPNESIYGKMIDALQEIAIPAREAIISFSQNYGPLIQEMVMQGNRLLKAISILGDHQYVYFAPLGKDLINDILQTDDVDEVLGRYEKNNQKNLEKIIKACRKSHNLYRHRRMFKQAVAAYNRGDYDISLIALISVLDGLLGISGGNIKEKMKQNADKMIKKITDDMEENCDEYLLFALKMTLSETIHTMVVTAPFNKEEPSKINRNWIMHGRSTRVIKPLDCIKIIRCIYGVIALGKITNNGTE